MGTETLSCHVDYPRPKKSRPSLECCQANWARLPNVVLHEIFCYLGQQDRINASSVCRSWRHVLYHPLWWKDVTFTIECKQWSKAKFLCSTFGHIVKNATIKFDSLSSECVGEFVTLLRQLAENYHLRSFVIEPRYCRIGPNFFYCDDNNEIKEIVNLIKSCSRRPLKRFSFGAIDALAKYTPDFLEILSQNRPQQIELLGLASIREEPGNFKPFKYDVKLFKPFTKLQVLSVDYDIVSDNFLHTLETAVELKRLVVHINGVDDNHPGTTNAAWQKFKIDHEGCELRLTMIHAYQEVHHLNLILKRNMPLSHLKVFFCEFVNLEALHLLSTWYSSTLRSVMYVDSQNNELDGTSWYIVRPPFEMHAGNLAPDPFVMMAWLCTRLEEIVLLGYKYMEEELVAIARLRAHTLKVLDVGHIDVQFGSDDMPHMDSRKDIPELLKKPWAPLKPKQLHPIIRDPRAGDSDEYLLPIVLSDIRLNQ